jgi:HEPN domain-containing protein
MTKSELTKTGRYWESGSKQDLLSAKEIIQKTSRYSSGLFFLHLSIEKKLKSVFVFRFEENPPYTHNLTFLAERCELKLSTSLVKFLSTVNEFNLSTRYPADKVKVQKKFNKEYAKRWLAKVEKFLQSLNTN